MARDPTRLSRVSVGYDNEVQENVDKDAGDAGAVFSTTTYGTDIGESGTGPIVQISTHTFATDLGTIAVQDSSVATVGISGATRGDSFIVQHDSEWSGADHDIVVTAQSGDTTGEVNIIAVNSTLTAVDTTAAVFRVTRINFGSYI